MVHSWKFTDDNGSFELPSPQHTSYLYFPLVNKAGMMSSITLTAEWGMLRLGSIHS